MKVAIRLVTVVLMVLLLTQALAPWTKACGPFFIQPIYISTSSPDVPFEDFARGNIGIVRPTFGRKTLTIAYRYLNGSFFNAEEQQALLDALKGRAPDEDSATEIKKWISARKVLAEQEGNLPEIYVERSYESYRFFPNCAANAFEVATATLKDRLASFGPDDPNLQAWVAGQDAVFQNCAGASELPVQIGPGGPRWLRFDRDYQIAAALFYSMRFDEARERFEAIAADPESPWQQTADYLVARTLVRQASLSGDESARKSLYDKAEIALQGLIGRNQRFRNASQKLLGLVKYRVHSEERVRELAEVLAHQSGNENLRQDLIDYVWLLDKFDAQVLKEEERKRKAKEPKPQESPDYTGNPSYKQWDAVRRGELINLSLYPKSVAGAPEPRSAQLFFKPDTAENEIFLGFETALDRKLEAEEQQHLREQRATALRERKWLLSAGNRLNLNEHEDYYGEEKITLDLVPEFLRTDDLSDWIYTVQSSEPKAYQHAVARWRATDSQAWFTAALMKAEKESPGLKSLINHAETIVRDAPNYPSIAYHLVRLKTATGHVVEARKLLDEILSAPLSRLPISAQNLFLAERLELAESVTEFLKFSQRRPMTFYNEGDYGSLAVLLGLEKARWEPDYYDQNKEEFDREAEARFKDLLPWDDRFNFDEKTIEVFNWHFPVPLLIEAAHNPALPDYLQRRLLLMAWTRAVLFENFGLADRIAPELIRAAPEMNDVLTGYLKAQTPAEKEHAAVFALLKFPGLSPVLEEGAPQFSTAEQVDYYFEIAWWCKPANEAYDESGELKPKSVPAPAFLKPDQLLAATKERDTLISLGGAKSYLGRKTIAWAKSSPEDPRLPEALFIALNANESYKYGCDGWGSDEETHQEIYSILQERYPGSPWTARLSPADK